MNFMFINRNLYISSRVDIAFLCGKTIGQDSKPWTGRVMAPSAYVGILRSNRYTSLGNSFEIFM